MIKNILHRKRKSKHIIYTEPAIRLTLNDILFLFNFGHLSKLCITNDDQPQIIDRKLKFNHYTIIIKEHSKFTLTVKVYYENSLLYENNQVLISIGQHLIDQQLQKILVLKSDPILLWPIQNDQTRSFELLVQANSLQINNIISNIESTTEVNSNLKITLNMIDS